MEEIFSLISKLPIECNSLSLYNSALFLLLSSNYTQLIPGQLISKGSPLLSLFKKCRWEDFSFILTRTSHSLLLELPGLDLDKSITTQLFNSQFNHALQLLYTLHQNLHSLHHSTTPSHTVSFYTGTSTSRTEISSSLSALLFTQYFQTITRLQTRIFHKRHTALSFSFSNQIAYFKALSNLKIPVASCASRTSRHGSVDFASYTSFALCSGFIDELKALSVVADRHLAIVLEILEFVLRRKCLSVLYCNVGAVLEEIRIGKLDLMEEKFRLLRNRESERSRFFLMRFSQAIVKIKLVRAICLANILSSYSKTFQEIFAERDGKGFYAEEDFKEGDKVVDVIFQSLGDVDQGESYKVAKNQLIFLILTKYLKVSYIFF